LTVAANCRVRVYIDETGRPERIRIDNPGETRRSPYCPAIAEERVKEAVMRWRFAPVQVNDTPVKVQWWVVVQFYP
jgi:hypothetical protein